MFGAVANVPSNIARPLKSRIKGIWAAVGEENATFVIKDSTIFYPDHNDTYKYSLKADSIFIRFDGFVGRYLIRMHGNDTLITRGDDKQVYYRFKVN
jgi:hypothetical protein